MSVGSCGAAHRLEEGGDGHSVSADGATPTTASGWRAGDPLLDRWYAVNSQVGREMLALEQLERQGFAAYLPRRWRTIRHARRVSEVKTPLFPGYLFVRLTNASPRWRSINGTRGVIRMVTSAGVPLPLPAGIVEGLFELTGEDGLIDLNCRYALGDRVKLQVGPFADFIGVVERDDGEGAVRVLLEMMQRTVRVDLDRRDLEAL